MLAILTAFIMITLGDPPARKEPPTQQELTAITDRGRDLAGYDTAAWHGSDALQAKQPKEGSEDALRQTCGILNIGIEASDLRHRA